MLGRSRLAVFIATLGVAALLLPTVSAHRRPRGHHHRRATAVIVVGKPTAVRHAVLVNGRPHGVLDMNVKPRATELWTDGKFRGTCDAFDGHPNKLRLLPGVHRIKLVTPDGVEVSRELHVRAGIEVNVGLDLR